MAFTGGMCTGKREGKVDRESYGNLTPIKREREDRVGWKNIRCRASLRRCQPGWQAVPGQRMLVRGSGPHVRRQRPSSGIPPCSGICWEQPRVPNFVLNITVDLKVWQPTVYLQQVLLERDLSGIAPWPSHVPRKITHDGHQLELIQDILVIVFLLH